MGENAYAATVGNRTDSKSKTKPNLTKTSYCRRTRQLCNARKLATERHTSSTRDSNYRSILTEKDHIRGEMASQNHLTQLFFAQEDSQERTAHMMRRRAQHEVFHIVHTFLIGRKKKPSSASEDIPHAQMFLAPGSSSQAAPLSCVCLPQQSSSRACHVSHLA